MARELSETEVRPEEGGAEVVRILEDAVEPVVELMGFELVMLEWLPSGRKRTLRVFLDHEAGVSLDDCARMSRTIGNALEAAEADASDGVAAVLTGPYDLEVSSPGLERPLVRRSHFERFVGRRATIKTHVPVEPGSNQKTFHGAIEGALADPHRPDDDRAGTVELRALEGGRVHVIPLPAIRRANLVYEG